MRRLPIVTVALLGLVVAMVGCSGGTKSATPEPSSPSASESSGALADAKALGSFSNGEFAIDVLSVQHMGSGMAIARFRLRNVTDNEAVDVRPYSTQYAAYDGWEDSFSREYLVDLAAGRMYYPPKAARTEKCLCTNFDELGGVELQPGGKPTYAWAAYALPADVSRVAVQDVRLGLVDQIPVAPADEPLPHVPGEPDVDQLTRDGGDPTALEFRSDAPARHSDEKGGKVTVDVSADVLFDFDSAKLGRGADAELDHVAQRIKTETDGPVHVTGYTDSKGSSSYNLKLSKKRAESVRDALDERLEGPMKFQVSGKGEANPVAPNRKDGHDNPKGRKKNRRVEISYQRAVERTDSSTPSADSTDSTPARTTLGNEVAGSEPYTKGLRAQVTGLHRLSHGILLTFTVHNTSSESVRPEQWGYTPEDYAGGYVSTYHGGQVFWVNLEDTSHTKYWVVADTEHHCVCTYGLDNLEPDRTQDLFAVLSAPPASTDTIDVHFSGYGTVQDVPISS